MGFGEQLLDRVYEVAYTPRTVTALVLQRRRPFVLQRVIPILPHWLLLVKLLQQGRGDGSRATRAAPTPSSPGYAPRSHIGHNGTFILKLMM